MVLEKELMCIIGTLKEFQTIFLGQILKKYTEHKILPVKVLITIEYQYGYLYLNIRSPRKNIPKVRRK